MNSNFPVDGDDVSRARALRFLASDSFVHFIGAGLLGLGSFILVPLYTRTMRPDQFGIYALIDISVVILVLTSQAKLDVAYLKMFADLDPSRYPALLGSVLTAGFSGAVVGGGVLAFAAWSSLGGRFLHTDERSFAWTLLPIVILEALQGLFLSDLRARRRAVRYCTSTLTRLLAMVGATIWFLSFQHLGLYGLFLGRMLGDMAGVLLLFVFCRANLVLTCDLSILRPMLYFGAPLIWGAVMMLLMDAAGRYVLTQYRGLADVGYLGAALKISSIFQMLVTQPFGIAWGGLMFQMAKWPNAKLIYSQIFSYVLLLASGVACIIAIFTRQLFHIFATQSYAPGMVLLPFLLLVRAIGIMEYPAAISIYLAGRTSWFAAIYTAAFLVNFGLNVWLDKAQGAMGVIIAWIAGWIVITALMRIVGQRVYRLDNHWWLWIVSVLPWLVLGALGPGRLSEIVAMKVALQCASALVIATVLVTLALIEYRRFRSEPRLRTSSVEEEVCIAE